MPNASLPPGGIPSHWAQQVFLLGDGWEVRPGDEIAFSVIWSDWAIHVLEPRITKRGKLSKRLAGKAKDAARQWQLPDAMRAQIADAGCWRSAHYAAAVDEALELLAVQDSPEAEREWERLGSARDKLLAASAMLGRGEVEAANQALLTAMQESLLPAPLPVP